MENINNFRYERKFVNQHLSSEEILDFIKKNPLNFSEIFYKRDVNNIYLDSTDMENYNDNIIGSPQRLKIRIRWYGNTFGLIKDPVLELKIKQAEVNSKLSFPLKPFILNENFSGDYLQLEVFDKSSLPNWLKETLMIFQPTLLNFYKRKYFMSQNKKYRVTLDTDLVFFEIKQKNNLFSHKIKDRNSSILEIKYNQKEDKNIQQLTQHLPLRLTKSSKYVYGVEILNL